MSGLVILAFVLLCSTTFGYIVEARDANDVRIVGGQDTEVGQFPYQASLRANVDEEWGQTCGASILNSKWILTAAHCFDNPSDPSERYVVVGSVLLSSGGVRHEIARVVVHEDYNGVTDPFNDIALAELVVEFEFSDSVQPIELETEYVSVVDCIIAGWGKLYEDGPISDRLQFLTSRSMTVEECRNYWVPEVIAESNLCTLNPEGEGVCNADSGSPLVADGKQIGVASRTWPCAHGVPDIFTRVSSYIGWIESNISG